MSLRWAIWTLTSPSQLLYLVVIGAAVLFLCGRHRAGRIAAVVAGVGVLALAVLPMARFLAGPLETRFPRPELPDRVDGIILLAGAERPSASAYFGEPQVGIEGGRYITALRLATRYPTAKLVYTGGSRVPAISQTRVAAAILGSTGLAPDRVIFEEESRDTCDHPGNVRALVGARPGEHWVVVTTALHVPRVVACFRAAGWPDVVPYPTNYRTIPDSLDLLSLQLNHNLGIVDDAVHEWVGLLLYRLTGKTEEVFPAPRTAGD